MDLAAIITALAVFVTAIGGVWIGIRQELRLWRADTRALLKGVEEVHHATNSMKDALVKAAKLQGASEEREAQVEREAQEKRDNMDSFHG